MKYLVVCLLLCFSTAELLAQNLVLNPGFETVSQSVSAVAAIDVASGWSSPTMDDPDLLGTNAAGFVYDRYGSSWNFRARSGNKVAAINVFGSTGTRPIDHDRQYIQGSLTKPLTPGKKYYFSFWVHYHCEGADNIGITFVPEKLGLNHAGQIALKPAAWQQEVTPYSQTTTWTQVTDSFIAYEAYSHFIIGNFFPDTETKVERSPLGHHYAYIDDVVVLEAEDAEMPVPMQSRSNEASSDWSDNLRAISRMTGDPVPAADPVLLPSPSSPAAIEEAFKAIIYFDLDSHLLDEEDQGILNSLARRLEETPDLKIMIMGHSSGEGGNGYNYRLSDRRAQSVRRYLIAQGISPNRLVIYPFGEERPAVSNQTETTRRQNRRVEFMVLW